LKRSISSLRHLSIFWKGKWRTECLYNLLHPLEIWRGWTKYLWSTTPFNSFWVFAEEKFERVTGNKSFPE